MSDENIVIGPRNTYLFQLLTVRGAVQLEKKGLRFKGGRSVKARWALAFGMNPRCSRDALLARISQEIETIRSGGILQPLDEPGDSSDPNSDEEVTT